MSEGAPADAPNGTAEEVANDRLAGAETASVSIESPAAIRERHVEIVGEQKPLGENKLRAVVGGPRLHADSRRRDAHRPRLPGELPKDLEAMDAREMDREELVGEMDRKPDAHDPLPTSGGGGCAVGRKGHEILAGCQRNDRSGEGVVGCWITAGG